MLFTTFVTTTPHLDEAAGDELDHEGRAGGGALEARRRTGGHAPHRNHRVHVVVGRHAVRHLDHGDSQRPQVALGVVRQLCRRRE